MKLQPTNDHILIRRTDANNKTPGGIVIPDAAREKRCVAEVLATGPGRTTEDGTRIRPCCEPGDVVVLARYAGTEVDLDGEQHLIIRDEDVLAVVAR